MRKTDRQKKEEKERKNEERKKERKDKYCEVFFVNFGRKMHSKPSIWSEWAWNHQNFSYIS